MTFDKGRLIDDITHLVPGRDDLLGALDRGDFDATLLDLRRFDAYRAAHPDSKLAGSGYFYPIGANRGYVGLASDPALLVAVNKALSDLQAAGTIAELGKAAGLTYLPPREPTILGDIWLKILQEVMRQSACQARPSSCASSCRSLQDVRCGRGHQGQRTNKGCARSSRSPSSLASGHALRTSGLPSPAPSGRS